jgi:RNA recognition motif-containing protein
MLSDFSTAAGWAFWVSLFSLAWFLAGILVGRRIRNLPFGLGGPDAGGGDAEREGRGEKVELYVGNLSYDLSEKELSKAFSDFGKIISARVIKNRFNGKSKGFGFVRMASRSDADKAIKQMNGKSIKGRKLIVNEAKSPPRR